LYFLLAEIFEINWTPCSSYVESERLYSSGNFSCWV